jgi:hypothetical protein
MNVIRELTEMEVEAVSGGGALFDIHLPDITIQNNIPVQNAVAVGVGVPAIAGNLIGDIKNFGLHA